MGTTIRLTSADGHALDAYRADPAGAAKGGIVVIQEIFGVNAHIRAVADGFAMLGYAALAPALFDRIERGVELGYSEDDKVEGRALRAKLGYDSALRDIAAAIDSLRPMKAAVIGYCWGGSLAWLAACRLDPDCAVCYYGAQIKDFAGEQPKCPVMLHFGEKDPLIPNEAVAAIRAAHPGIPLFAYAAGHGFNCDMREDYDAKAAELALSRTREMLRKYIG
jgi:carboxymethylenebutenolidase